MLNKLRCHAQFKFSANQIAWSRLLIQIHSLNVLKFRTLYSIHFLPKFYFLCSWFLKYLVEWQTVLTLIRLFLKDLGLHCFHMPFCHKTSVYEILEDIYRIWILSEHLGLIWILSEHLKITQTSFSSFLSTDMSFSHIEQGPCYHSGFIHSNR